MTFEDAAAIPQAGMLAVQGLIDKGNIRPGQKLLINGAGGGVGTFGIQLAKLHGIETTGVDSSDKLDLMKSMGFDHVMDYKQQDFTSTGQQYDVILDVKTNRPIFHYLRALRPGGTYATVGGHLSRLFQALIFAPFISIFTKKKVTIVALKANKGLGYMNDLFESGKLKCVIDGPYKLEQASEVFRRFGKGEHKGKVVFIIKNAY
jgi:NADPH:quinone reductase-like Zn-dependent oxidoreductase